MQNSELAVPQLAAVKITGLTRQTFILRSAMAAGAVYGAGVVGPYVQQAFAQAPEEGDVSIVNFALTLEYLEATFYQEALKQVPDLSPEASELAKEIGGNEIEHVEALIATLEDLGAEPVKEPSFDWGDSFKDEATFLKTAIAFEDTGVSAYNGAGPSIQNKDILAAAGSIVQVEGRHAALVRGLNGEEPTIAAFDEPLGTQEVLDAVAPFIKA